MIEEFLSNKGKKILFQHKGIISQSIDAKDTKINATIGVANEEDGSLVKFTNLYKSFRLSIKDVLAYSSVYGNKSLRKLWQKSIFEKNPSLLNKISLPIVTNGLTHALNISGYLFVDPFEKIIIQDFYWENYDQIFEIAYDSILDKYNTFKNEKLDLLSFEKKLSERERKAVIIFNFPNNPTGYTPDEKEVDSICEIIKKKAENTKIVIIIDDAYFGIVFTSSAYKESLFSKLASLHENVLAVKVDGVSKEEFAWGLRVGFLTYGKKNISLDDIKLLEDKTAAIIRASISNVSNLSQQVLLDGLDKPNYKEEKLQKFNLLKNRFLKIKKIIKNKNYEKAFLALPCNSGYFICLRVNKNVDIEKIRIILNEKYDVGVIAIKNVIRIAFSSTAEQDFEVLFEKLYLSIQECNEVTT